MFPVPRWWSLADLVCRVARICAHAGILMVAFLAKAEPAPAEVDFLRDVRPILASHCLKCHGPDDDARKAKLRLDVRELALKPAKSGETAIVPGQPDKSELIRRIYAEDEDDVMPPPAAKNPLNPEDKAVLKRWISSGAPYKPHWAWVKPVQGPLPTVRNTGWPRNPIDYFVLARLEREGLKPSPAADKETLVRRLYLDLIGTVPTPEQSEAFIQDTSSDAYERLVDQLLASPHYGERWARRWLDLARYADTNGYEKDRPRSMWPWRDWVIGALNADTPFDQFTIKQLAGDMLTNATEQDIIATGFNRNSMLNEEGGIDPLEFRFYSMVDRVHVTATTWLGLTMQCAQCHTHKFDPIQHQEYYQFMAFLDDCDEPTLTIPDPAVAAKRRTAQTKIDEMEAGLIDQFPVESRIEWVTPAEVEFSSDYGSEAERLDDGSLRVSGKNPEKDNYTLEFNVSSPRISHLQIEAIPDENLAKGGFGRGDQGAFVVSEIEMRVQANADNAEPQEVKFSAAKADSTVEKFAPENAIDGKTDTGWAAKPGQGRHARAIFALETPIAAEGGAKVTVRLIQQAGGHRTLGHFRVSIGGELPDARPPAERRQVHRDRKFARWLEAEAAKVVPWKRLRPVQATSQIPSLDVESDDSVFASGDFSKNDTYTLQFRDLPAGVKAIRIEALPDDRLPGRGPGRVYYEGEPGDFFLSNLKVIAAGQPVALTNATESFARDQDTAFKAIDADLQSGWSIRGQEGRTHNAVFQLAQPLTETNELQIELTFERYYASALGRFRIWVSTATDAQASALPNDLYDVLQKYRTPAALRTLLTATETATDRALLMRNFLTVAPELAEARKEIAKLRSELPKFPTTLVMQERSAAHPRQTHLHHRGEFLQARQAVEPGVPSFLPPLAREAPHNRLGLAQWLVSPDNPLTARVVANRHWEGFFGRGLVRTTEDFGFQGDLPSHPELLDWLAVEFRKLGWSQKKLHRLMVCSATYRQSSAVTPQLLERDPQNILLARGPRFRVEAEIVRDAALKASGLLSEKLGGPSVFPPQPPGVSTEGAYGELKWIVSKGEDRYRRGLYTFAKRTTPFAMSATFDGPSGEACLARRDRSNTPLQALTLLNDTVYMECSRALGKIATDIDGPAESRVTSLFQRCLTRNPSKAECERLVHFYEGQLDRFNRGELKAAQVLGSADSRDPNRQAAWTTLARVLLNLDEMITKE